MTKLKYKFRVHYLMDSYPTTEDILFDILNFFHEKNINIEKEWTISTIRDAFHKKISDEEISIFLQKLIEDGFLIKREDDKKNNYFIIKKNIF